MPEGEPLSTETVEASDTLEDLVNEQERDVAELEQQTSEELMRERREWVEEDCIKKHLIKWALQKFGSMINESANGKQAEKLLKLKTAHVTRNQPEIREYIKTGKLTNPEGFSHLTCWFSLDQSKFEQQDSRGNSKTLKFISSINVHYTGGEKKNEKVFNKLLTNAQKGDIGEADREGRLEEKTKKG